MPQVLWPLLHDRPMVRVLLTLAATGQQVSRYLVADTGAGTARSGFELVLAEQDCLACGGMPFQAVLLGGAYAGSFPIHLMRVQVPELSFDHHLHAVGVPVCPPGFGGIAAFRFLNRFTYGNFGDPGQFGLET